jgi:hypothetical protein
MCAGVADVRFGAAKFLETAEQGLAPVLVLNESVNFDGVDILVKFTEAAKSFKLAAEQGIRLVNSIMDFVCWKGGELNEMLWRPINILHVQQPKVNLMVW